MDPIPGSRVNSKNFTTVKVESSYQDPTHFEAEITAIFEPWIIAGIPDTTWQSVQEKLGGIVRDMLSGRKVRSK